ncbi:ferredoxin family protein [Candidatus Binatia bacterium]|nr:ferredoxin family protein [Candidatus Binatia bacterium]
MIERLDAALCSGCGLCLEVCPSDVFRPVPGRRVYVIAYPEDCQTCFNCEIECPEAAIDVAPWRKARTRAW